MEDRFALTAACLMLATGALAFTPTEWTAHVPEGGLRWERTSNGVKLTLSARGFGKGGDGFVSTDIPLVRRGRIDFDYRDNCDSRNRTVGPFLAFYGIRTFWHDACSDWRAYFPEPNAKREVSFNIEPVVHKQIARNAHGVWHHCRIVFDQAADRVEYYLDDMDDPAYMTGDRSVWAEAEFQGGELRIGGMGGSKDGVYEFKDIVLTEEREDGTAAVRTETLVFDGLASSHYGLKRILAADRPRVYTLDFTRSMFLPANAFKYVKLPGAGTMRRARRIVLADAPAGPNAALPKFLLDDIAKAVEDGAELIVLDGLLGLSRGEYAETALARILPEGALAAAPFSDAGGARVLERKVGKGRTAVVTGLRFPKPAQFRSADGEWAKIAVRLFGEGVARHFE